MKLVKSLSIKHGPNENKKTLTFNPTGITIFVGPNNSGKSLALRELEQICFTYNNRDTNLIQEITFESFSYEHFEKDIASKITTPIGSERLGPDEVMIQRITTPQGFNTREKFNTRQIKEFFEKNNNLHYIARFYLSLLTVRLDGSTRTNLLQNQNLGDLLSSPTNILASLWVNSEKRAKLRELTYDAFGEYFTMDALMQHQIRARLSPEPPKDEDEEQSLSERSRNFHRNSKEIMYCSDGVKAYTGILANILGHNSKICLLDEPEAFLHPPLAKRLGKELSAISGREDANVFVATHSADFLMGCIQSGAPINVVRLTYRDGASTAKILPENKILPLMRNPLLRSTGVLSGLFYESVIVTEADADRAFYQEINERLLAENDPRGIQNCLFINAQNKQTIWDIVKPLRELGIPTLGIVDIDFLKDGGTVGTKPLIATNIPEVSHASFHSDRQAINKALDETGKNMKRDGGISLLTGATLEAATNLLERYAEYGILLVPTGELESWLSNLNASREKYKWLIETFEKMGDNPDQTGYVKPTTDDVWGFIGFANKWFKNGQRKGMPSS